MPDLHFFFSSASPTSDPDELRAWPRQSPAFNCVQHKNLRDRNRKRYAGLLRDVDPAIAYMGFEAVWELGMKTTAAGPDGCAALGG